MGVDRNLLIGIFVGVDRNLLIGIFVGFVGIDRNLWSLLELIGIFGVCPESLEFVGIFGVSWNPWICLEAI